MVTAIITGLRSGITNPCNHGETESEKLSRLGVGQTYLRFAFARFPNQVVSTSIWADGTLGDADSRSVTESLSQDLKRGVLHRSDGQPAQRVQQRERNREEREGARLVRRAQLDRDGVQQRRDPERHLRARAREQRVAREARSGRQRQ